MKAIICCDRALIVEMCHDDRAKVRLRHGADLTYPLLEALA